MKKLLINVRLSEEYQLLNTVKRVNYPYKRAFQLFMLSVIRLSVREQLDPYRTVGRIGYALANDKATDWMTPEVKGEPVQIRYREENEEIVSYYEAVTDMTNKQLTTLFLRLLIRLCHTYGPHIADLVYLIDTLPVAITGEIDKTPASKVKLSLPTTPRTSDAVVSKPKRSVAKPVAEKPVVEPVVEEPVIEPVVEEPVVADKPEPVIEPVVEAKPEPVVEEEPAVTELDVKPAVESKSEDDFISRAKRLRDDAEASLNDDVVVEQNTMLSDFYNVDDE